MYLSKKYFQHQSISLHVVYFECILVILGLIMMFTLYDGLRHQMEDQKAEYMQDALLQKQSNVNNRLQKKSKI